MLELGGREVPNVLGQLELTTTIALDFGQAQRKNAGVIVGLWWATR